MAQADQHETDAHDIARALYALKYPPAPTLRDQRPSDVYADLKSRFSSDHKKILSNIDIVFETGFALRLPKNGRIFLGGGAVVFEVQNIRVPSLRYALKVQRPSLVSSEAAVVERERGLAEYIRHAPLSHENVAGVLGAWRAYVPRNDDGTLLECLIMLVEWVDEAELFNKYAKSKQDQITPKSYVDLLIQSLKAIQYLNDANLIHWDIKSENLLVNKWGRVKLMDFGNARRRSSPDPETSPSAALTTRAKYPPALGLPSIDDGAFDSRRVEFKLNTSDWDVPWLDLWMFAHEVAQLLGIGHHASKLPPPSNEGEWTETRVARLRDGDPLFRQKCFPPNDEDAQFVLRYLQLVLARLLCPQKPAAERYYSDAADVVRDLEKLFPEFGDAQDLSDLWATPQHVVRLPISGNVALSRRFQALISSRVVTRLRSHSQLGTIFQVYPGAIHSRFEHTIGVFHTTIQFIKALYADHTGIFWRISTTRSDIEALLCAAILHDIGHVTCGHFLEEMPGLFQASTHEAYVQVVLRGTNSALSETMSLFEEDILRDRSELLGVFEEIWGFERPEAEAFMARIASILDPKLELRDAGSIALKPHAEMTKSQSDLVLLQVLHSVIDSPIDADKLDYLLRDGAHAGVHYPRGIDVDRFLQSLTTMHFFGTEGWTESRTGKAAAQVKPSIAVNRKGVLPVESILFARYQMFQSIYWHHTARAHTAMLQYCVTEAAAMDADVDGAFAKIVQEFRRRDDRSALRWLANHIASRRNEHSLTLESSCLGLLGNRRAMYKEGYTLQFKPDRYGRDLSGDKLREFLRDKSRLLSAASSRVAFIDLMRSMRSDVGSSFGNILHRDFKMEIDIDDGEILIDIPPEGRDQYRNIYVVDDEGARFIDELSPMATAVGETFRNWGRQFRVFCAPSLLEKLGVLSKREIAWAFWAALLRYGQIAEQVTFPFDPERPRSLPTA